MRGSERVGVRFVTTPAPPVPTSEAWLGEWLTDILDKCAQILGPTAPSRRYVSAGTPAADCNQLTVHADAIYPGGNFPTRPDLIPQASLNFMPIVRLIIILWRCVPTRESEGRAPGADELNAHGLANAHEGQALWYGLVRSTIDGTLWPTQNRPIVLWRECKQLPSQGNLAGWQVTGEISLT